jgi:hypothetical protein
MGFQLWNHLDLSQWIYLLLKVIWTSLSTLILIQMISILAGTRFLLLGSLQMFYFLISVIIVLSTSHIFPSIFLSLLDFLILIRYLNFLHNKTWS